MVFLAREFPGRLGLPSFFLGVAGAFLFLGVAFFLLFFQVWRAPCLFFSRCEGPLDPGTA